MGAVDFSAANPQLELSLVQFRATVKELRSQYLLVPFPRSVLVANLDIDVLNHRNS
jgi:hypothetical protein